MSGGRGVRRAFYVAGLVFAWCALWGEVSVANLASGILVAVAVIALGVGNDTTGGIRPGPLARFFGLVAVDLVTSTVNVAREVLTPTDRTEEAIIRVDVPTATRGHELLMVIAVTVTPGTAVVDVDPDTGALYLHLLHYQRADSVTRHVEELAELACRALPLPVEEQETPR